MGTPWWSSLQRYLRSRRLTIRIASPTRSEREVLLGLFNVIDNTIGVSVEVVGS